MGPKIGGVPIFKSDKIDFKKWAVTIDKAHFVMMNASIQQKDKNFKNIYVSNIGTPNYIEQILMEIK